MPGSLSTNRTPSIDSFECMIYLGKKFGFCSLDRACHASTSCKGVAAATELPANLAYANTFVFRARTDTNLSGVEFLKEDRDMDALDGAEVIDEAFTVIEFQS